MIQLYKAGNTSYSMNGDFSLSPIKAELTMELNGAWTLDLEIPQTDQEVVDALEHDTIIKADLPKYKGQLYVVTNPQRTDYDTVTAQCYPIGMYDAQNELIVRDCRPTGMTGKAALEYILKASGGAGKYAVDCNISKLSTAYYVRKNFMECLASDDDNSFLNRWGGEIIYDNYNFRVYEQAGVDRDFILEASKNISGFQVSEDDSDYCDVIIPVGYNGWTCPSEVRRSETSRVLHRRFVEYSHIKHIDDASEEDADDESLIICKDDKAMEAALVKAAQDSFAAGEFQSKFTYDIDFVDLRQYGGYEQYDDLLYLWLGDRVQVKNLDKHVQTQQKVIGLTYDLVNDEITKIVLGSAAKDFFNATSQAVSDLDKVRSTLGTVVDDRDGRNRLIAERVGGIINAMETSMRAQKNSAVRQDARAILFEDLDKSSPTFGAMCLGTQGLQISKKRTPDDSDWVWGTAINYESVIADAIITGLLSGKNANFWFNLDTGEFELGSGLFKGTISTTENARIGKRLYLDYDRTVNDSYQSGVFLGDEESSKQMPQLLLTRWDEDLMRSVLLRTQNATDAPEVGVVERYYTGKREGEAFLRVTTDSSVTAMPKAVVVKSPDVELRSGTTRVVVKEEGIWLISPKLFVNDNAGNTGVGVTYTGAVNSIRTVNGIVTGVS